MGIQSTEFTLADWDIPAEDRCANTGRPMRSCNTCGGKIPAQWSDCTPKQLEARKLAKAWNDARRANE